MIREWFPGRLPAQIELEAGETAPFRQAAMRFQAAIELSKGRRDEGGEEESEEAEQMTMHQVE